MTEATGDGGIPGKADASDAGAAAQAAAGQGTAGQAAAGHGAAVRTGTADGEFTVSHRQIMVILPGLLIAMMLAMLDQLIVGTALPRIVGDLGGVSHLSWVVSA